MGNFDPRGDYVKAFSVDENLGSGIVTVNITLRVHWQTTDCPDKSKLRDFREQKKFDEEAAKIWTGSFKEAIGKRVKMTYNVTTKIQATYGDAGDPFPSENFTLIMQNPEWPSSDFRPNATIGSPSRGGQKVELSVELYNGNTPKIYAHELGHIMGLEDQYKDVYYPILKRFVSVPNEGWEDNIMATRLGDVDYRNIRDIIPIWRKEK